MRSIPKVIQSARQITTSAFRASSQYSKMDQEMTSSFRRVLIMNELESKVERQAIRSRIIPSANNYYRQQVFSKNEQQIIVVTDL
jgi:hypothetical protein